MGEGIVGEVKEGRRSKGSSTSISCLSGVDENEKSCRLGPKTLGVGRTCLLGALQAEGKWANSMGKVLEAQGQDEAKRLVVLAIRPSGWI